MIFLSVLFWTIRHREGLIYMKRYLKLFHLKDFSSSIKCYFFLAFESTRIKHISFYWWSIVLFVYSLCPVQGQRWAWSIYKQSMGKRVGMLTAHLRAMQKIINSPAILAKTCMFLYCWKKKNRVPQKTEEYRVPTESARKSYKKSSAQPGFKSEIFVLTTTPSCSFVMTTT